mmetsp:Transcript_19949/g.41839  ORF Transcript_19949/g.41839 Transcript_19949/m.41839 type:complete len:329 (-) Transcript_19949:67-1053(-)
MKSVGTPLSPYGVFTGSLFQYSSSPSLIAFESPPLTIPPKDDNPSILNTKGFPNKLILLGGLSDGPLPCPYTSSLEQKCHELEWSLVQPILSSSYLGFGHGSLSRDTGEICKLMNYLVCHHDAEKFALVGHSTGCQNSIHFLKHGEKDLIDRVSACVLQAPVSDRESQTLSPGDHAKHLTYAKQLVSQNKGEDFMPRESFWAPISASRYVSLFDIGGDDDFFSSDFLDAELLERLGHVGKLNLKLLAVYSGSDEFVPSWVDKDLLLKRLVWAMNKNNTGEKFDDKRECDKVESDPVATGLFLESANHNLSEGDGDIIRFVNAVGALLK